VLEITNHPAFQSGVAPLAVALAIALALARTRFAWLAIIPAYATMVALDTGFSLFPPTVARKTMLVGFLVPLVGVGADLYPRTSRAIAAVLVIATGLLSIWVFSTVLQNREPASAVAAGAGVVAFVAALVAAMLRLRDDGPRAGATGLGLGLAVGIAGVLSASIGALMAGVAIAAACAAMLILQAALSRALVPGFTGALPIGLVCALVAAGTLLLAELPWYALPLLLLIPVATSLPAPTRGQFARIAALSGYALVAAAIPIGAAWYAARGALF
jgi:hypothetical protein